MGRERVHWKYAFDTPIYITTKFIDHGRFAVDIAKGAKGGKHHVSENDKGAFIKYVDDTVISHNDACSNAVQRAKNHIYRSRSNTMTWSELNNLTPIKQVLTKENKMILQDEKTMAGTLSNGRYTVGVRILEGSNVSPKLYAFYADPNTKLYVNDLVVVNVYDTYALAVVWDEELSASQLGKACKWVVSKVDITAHKTRIEREQKAKKLEQAMDELLAKQDKMAKIQLMAQSNPAMRELVQQMAELQPEMYGELLIEDKGGK